MNKTHGRVFDRLVHFSDTVLDCVGVATGQYWLKLLQACWWGTISRIFLDKKSP